MSDLVERLRQIYDDEGVPQEAADRIEHLERLFNRDYEEMRQQAADNARLVEAADKRIEALEAALRPFARLIELLDERDEIPETSGLVRAFLVADLRRARRALEGKHE